jgi:hypothetical protein
MLNSANLYGKFPIVPMRNGAVGTNLELLTPVGADVNQYNILQRETAVSISSSSTDDDGAPAGTGALTVKVYGYGRDLAAVTETFTMNGQTAVTGTELFMYVSAIEVLTVGSGAASAGDIYVIRIGESTLSSGVPATLSAIMGKLASGAAAAAVTAVGYTFAVASSATADASAGPGARTINPVSEVVTMNGRTAVLGTSRMARVHAAVVTTAGTGLVNAGDIYVYGPSDSVTLSSGVPTALTNVLCKIPLGLGQGTSGLWTVPVNTKYKILGLTIGGSGAAGTFAIQTRGIDLALTGAAEVEVKTTLEQFDTFTTGPTFIDLSYLPTINAVTDIEIRALSAGTGLFSALLHLERMS